MKVTAWILLLVCAGPAYAMRGPDQSDKKEVLSQARQAYYSLRRLGLVEFQANIKPNWELVVKQQLSADPSRAQAALKLLAGLYFAMRLDQNGDVKVTHRADEPAANEETAAGFKQIFEGMDEAVTGVFMTWSPFMLTSPFPEVASEYQLEDAGGQYRLSYRDGSVAVATTMGRNFAISELTIVGTTFKSSIRPQFTKTEKGFVLAGYDADYDPASGPGHTRLKVRIDYQETNGLQLPQKVNVDSTYDGSHTEMELVFADYQVKTR